MDPAESEATANALPPKSGAKGHGKQRKRLVDDRSELLALATAASGAQEAEVRDKLEKTRAQQSSSGSRGKSHEEDRTKKGKKSSRLLKMKAELAKGSSKSKSAKKRLQGGEAGRDQVRKKAVSFA